MLWRICLNQWEKNSRHGREGSITPPIYWNDLSKSIEIFSNHSSKLKFLHNRVSASVIWKGKEISLKWLKYRMSTFSSLEWNSHFDKIGWNGQSSCLAAACFIVFISNCPWHLNPPLVATYCMRGFLTYLSQSLGEANAREVGTRGIWVDGYIPYIAGENT